MFDTCRNCLGVSETALPNKNEWKPKRNKSLAIFYWRFLRTQEGERWWGWSARFPRLKSSVQVIVIVVFMIDITRVGRKILVQKANSCMTKILPKESRNMIGLHSKETTRSFTYRTAASQYFPSYRSVRTFCTVSGSKPALPIIRDLNNCITFILHSINICTAIEKKDDATTARLLSQITKDYSKQDYSQFLIEPFERFVKK